MGKVERGILNDTGYEVWMHRRERAHYEEVDPVHVQEIDGCHVVWARREGVSERGQFNIYHIGCDHLGTVPVGGSEIGAVLACSAVHKYIKSAATEAAAETFGVDKIIPSFLTVEDEEIYLDEEGQAIASNFIFESLAKTIGEPERCHGNIRDGLHLKPVLAFMLGGVAEPQMNEIIDLLEFNGTVTHYDPYVQIKEIAA